MSQWTTLAGRTKQPLLPLPKREVGHWRGGRPSARWYITDAGLIFTVSMTRDEGRLRKAAIKWPVD